LVHVISRVGGDASGEYTCSTEVARLRIAVRYPLFLADMLPPPTGCERVKSIKNSSLITRDAGFSRASSTWIAV